jgi:hypothetical protein
MENMTFDEYLANPGDPELKQLFDEADRIWRRGELCDKRTALRLQMIELQAQLLEVEAEIAQMDGKGAIDYLL